MDGERKGGSFLKEREFRLGKALPSGECTRAGCDR